MDLIRSLVSALNKYLPNTFQLTPTSLTLILFVLDGYFLWKLSKLDSDMRLSLTEWFYPTKKLRKFFSNKVVWITGASSGLGKALALELAKYPCKLVLSARRKEQLQEVKELCLKENPHLTSDSILVLPLDSLEFDQCPSLVEEVKEHFGTIDILVNNAGRSQRSLAESTPIEVDKAIMELNFFGYVALSKAVLPTMIANKSGCIVAVSSLTGKMGAPVSTAYAASKHAVMGFFSSLRMELYPHGISVLTCCPGPVRSDISLHSFTDDINVKYNQESQESGRKQATDRFARLFAISIAAQLPESWISIQPYLLYNYLAQYFPSVTNSVLFSMGAQKRITKFKNKECLY